MCMPSVFLFCATLEPDETCGITFLFFICQKRHLEKRRLHQKRKKINLFKVHKRNDPRSRKNFPQTLRCGKFSSCPLLRKGPHQKSKRIHRKVCSLRCAFRKDVHAVCVFCFVQLWSQMKLVASHFFFSSVRKVTWSKGGVTKETTHAQEQLLRKHCVTAYWLTRKGKESAARFVHSDVPSAKMCMAIL